MQKLESIANRNGPGRGKSSNAQLSSIDGQERFFRNKQRIHQYKQSVKQAEIELYCLECIQLSYHWDKRKEMLGLNTHYSYQNRLNIIPNVLSCMFLCQIEISLYI